MSGCIREFLKGAFWFLLTALLPAVAGAQVTPITVDNVCSASGPGASPPAGGVPFSPGRWWNPERAGTGWDVHFSDIGADGKRTLAMVWFSYDRSGRPTWFVTSGPREPSSNQWSGDLYSATWDFEQNRRTSMAKKGTIQLRFQPADATRIGLQWQLDALGPQLQPPECIRDFGVSIQHPNRGDNPGNAGVNAAFSGMWIAEGLDTNPGQSIQSWSLFQTILPITVNQSTLYRESAVIATYDDSGYPVWLDATDQEHQPASAMELGIQRTLNFVYYYASTLYPNGVPNTQCGGNVCRIGHNLTDSDWKRVFNSPALGHGRPVVQLPAAESPKAQGITRLLRPGTPSARLRKITAVNQIVVDRPECPVAGDAGCSLTVSWTSSLPWATIHREVQLGSAGSTTTTQLSMGVHGAQVDNLQSGAIVSYVLRDNGGRVLHQTPPVIATGPVPLRINETQAQVLSGTAPSTVRLSANVAGGIPPVQVEYFVDSRSLGISKDSAHQLEWLDVGPGSYNVTFRATDSNNPPSTVEVTRQVIVATPSPAAAAVADLESDSVGSSAGSFRVDEGGAATYAMPLTLPPGRAGVAPSLGLQYSSQAGEGSIGRGWSLSGLSNIMRCRPTREAGDFESKTGTPSETPSQIRFDANDRFCLDGQRLVPAARPAQCRSLAGYLSNELRTEIDSFQRICAYTPASGSASSNGPRAFSIEGKDGSRRWYGEHNGQEALPSLSLRQTAAAESPVYLWALNRTQDSVGNYVDYRYLVDLHSGPNPNVFPERLPGALLVNSIRYAGRISPAAAPHSEVRFNYGATARTDRFVAGRAFTNTQRLTSIDVLDQGSVMRHYALNYDDSSPLEFALDGRQKSLKSIQECTAAPTNGVAPAGHACLTPTVFDYGAFDQPFGSRQPGFTIETGSNLKFEGQRIADIDGDGLSDIVWVKDVRDGESCSVQPGPSGTDTISVSFLDRPNGVVAFKTTPALCTQVELMNRTWEHGTPPDEAWFLYDYDRDGKTDLFYRGGEKWIGHRATGNRDQPFNTAIDLLATLSIPPGTETKYFPRPVDLNGDGLMDLVRFENATRQPRLLVHLHQTTRDPSKPANPGWSQPIEVSYSNPCEGAQLNSCAATLLGLYDEDSFEQQLDKNGDGVADLHLLFTVVAAWPPGVGGSGGPGNPGWPDVLPQRPGTNPNQGEAPTAGGLTAKEVVVIMRTVRVGLGGIELVHERGLFGKSFDNKTRYADLNNDGLTDTYTTAFNPGGSSYALNTGTSASFGSLRCLLGSNWGANDDPSGIADVNGDGIPDYYSYHTDGHSLQVYPGRAGLDGSENGCWSLFDTRPMRMGSNTSNFATWDQTDVNPKRRNLMFGDWDGDGLGDLLVMVPGGTANIHFNFYPHSSRRAQPPGMLTAITDGLGGRTDITYKPLSNPAVYRADRTTNDSAYGRGSAVHDVRGSMNVVAKVETSAPSIFNTGRKAALYYRYVGAKMQTGGRGLLGFREIHTIDPNHSNAFALTISTYHQNFPFIGAPESTERWVINQAFAPDGCFSVLSEACRAQLNQAFPTPDVAYGGSARLVSDATEHYAFAWDSAPDIELNNFAGVGVQPMAVQVRRIRSEEHSYDLGNGGRVSASVNLYSYHHKGAYDSYGNVMRTRSFTFEASPAANSSGEFSNWLSRVETLNTYTNDVSSSRWNPGRLTSTRVTHGRAGSTVPEVVRESSFSYVGSGPAQGMLLSETVEPNGAAHERLHTYYAYDGFGNRIGTYTCGSSVSMSTCMSRNHLFNNPTDPLYVHRWTETQYSADGRYALTTQSPYTTGVRTDSQVLALNGWGQPLLIRGLNGAYARTTYGRFGRAYEQWTQTVASKVDPLNGANAAAGQGPNLSLGVNTRSTYRQCSASVACPPGAVFREEISGDAQPKAWTYFDALARPVVKIGELLNADIAVAAARSGVCMDYDVQGRTLRQSEPRALPGSGEPAIDVLATFCAQMPSHDWSETQYDPLGRPIKQLAPQDTDRALTEIQYRGGLTITTLPATGDGLRRFRSERRNALGELVYVAAADGADTAYSYSATGDLLRVARTLGTSTDVVSTMAYDRLGRKIRTEDPDAGVWNYRYNAVGELVAQYDGAYADPSTAVPTSALRTLQIYDARGRVVSKENYHAGSANFQTRHTYEYDHSTATAFGKVAGALWRETTAGQYDNQNLVNFSRTHVYDDLGRPIGSETRIDHNDSYTVVAHYDRYGRVWKTMDASKSWLKTEFGARGFALAQCASTAMDFGPGCASNSAQTYMRVQAVNARGQTITEQRGVNLSITSAYSASTGQLLSRCSGNSQCNLQRDDYQWDSLGNLLWRERTASSSFSSSRPRYRETFTYDRINRVTDATMALYDTTTGTNPVTSFTSLTMRYDFFGNVCQRTTTAGTLFMHYAGSSWCNGAAAQPAHGNAAGYASPNAVTRATQAVGDTTNFTSYAYDAHGNQVAALRTGTSPGLLPPERTILYTVEQQAWQMRQTAGGQTSRFYYGPDGARYKRIDQGNGATKRTYYMGNVEVVLTNATPSLRRYLAGVAVQDIDANGGRTTSRLLHDHLGSVTAVIRDIDHMVMERYDYGAFGERRGALGDVRNGWTMPVRTNRGFTGHEMLDDIGLVHMNGRIYDSRTARFLQADPFVQEPNNSQNFNRFSYLWNNPLNATDPSGYLGVKERQWASAVLTIVAIAFQQYGLAAKLQAWGTVAYYAAVGAASGGIATQSWNGAMQGAFTSAVTAGAGIATSGLKVWQAALVNGVSNGMLTSLQGGKFGHGFVSAGLSTYAGQYTPNVGGPVGQVLLDAIVGGTISELSGGKFANGAVTAAMRSAVRGAATSSNQPAQNGASGTLADVTPGYGVLRPVARTSTIVPVEFIFHGDVRFSVTPWLDAATEIYSSHGIDIEFQVGSAGEEGLKVFVAWVPTGRSFARISFQGLRTYDVTMDFSAPPSVFAHELAHAFGLIDRYRDVRDSTGAVRSVSHPGFEGNLMGADRGTGLYSWQLDIVRANLATRFSNRLRAAEALP